ncbi:MAG: PLP-dependent aminotransferase family protein [Emergencia timonensis]
MNITINRNSETPIYLQIAGTIKNMIEKNELVKGYKLPGERQLASELGVHRNTVVKAYGELVSEGLLTASRQAPKGYFVQSAVNSWNFNNRFFPLEKMIRYHYNERDKRFLEIFNDSVDKGYISFGGIVMDKKVNPAGDMGSIVKHMLQFDEDGEIMSFYHDDSERLKKNICHILAAENMYVNAKNVQIVAETNQALYYLMTLYLSEGDSVIVEEPIVPDNASIFRNGGLNMVTVPMEADGMDMDKLEMQIKKHKPKFIYTMPNFHNPTGAVMSLSKRERLLEIAQRYGVPIIEEDSQRDFRYTQERLPSLYSLDQYKSVVYVDSFTLTFPYGVKVGYVVGPYDLVDMLGRLITMTETFVSNMGAYMISEYIERGFFAEHTKRLAAYYSQKLDLLCSQLDQIEQKGITYQKPQGGILLWCTLDENINERKLFLAAKEKGVLMMPGFLFYPYGYQGRGHIRLCFSNVSDQEIVDGVRLLGEAIDQVKTKENCDE